MRKIQVIVFLLTAITLSACSKILHPNTVDYVGFVVGEEHMRIGVEPYVNAMPGSTSNDVIIPIVLRVTNNEDYAEWKRKYKITKVSVSGVPAIHTQLSDLDHNEWMHNSADYDSRNCLRISLDITDRFFGKITLHFKDDRGKRYKVTFRGLSAGNVY